MDTSTKPGPSAAPLWDFSDLTDRAALRARIDRMTTERSRHIKRHGRFVAALNDPNTPASEQALLKERINAANLAIDELNTKLEAAREELRATNRARPMTAATPTLPPPRVIRRMSEPDMEPDTEPDIDDDPRKLLRRSIKRTKKKAAVRQERIDVLDKDIAWRVRVAAVIAGTTSRSECDPRVVSAADYYIRRNKNPLAAVPALREMVIQRTRERDEWLALAAKMERELAEIDEVTVDGD